MGEEGTTEATPQDGPCQNDQTQRCDRRPKRGRTVRGWLRERPSHLEQPGSADVVIGWVYVGLLGVVGLCILRDARTGDTHAGTGRLATGLQALEISPIVSLTCGTSISVWVVLGVGLGVGFLSGFLGVGGGFLLMPVMVYGFGVPAAVAVGTDILQIVLSSAFGTFIYAQSNAVDIPVVVAMLGGSALGARIGAGATRLVDEADIKGHFAVTLLAGSGAVASEQLSDAYAVAMLDMVSAVLIFGAVCLVSGAIVHASIDTLRERRERGPPTTL